jgi:hypothetical protein
MKRRIIICAIAAGLTIVAGCGSQPGVTAAPPTTQPKPVGPLVLAQFDRGVGAVHTGSAAPVWTDPDAVAALDGSAVFSVRSLNTDPSVPDAYSEHLVRLDPDTGEILSTWPLKAGTRPGAAGTLAIGAVSPAGRWVALTGEGHSSASATTELVVFDTAAGTDIHSFELTGDLRPEAFSVDGTFVFALDYRGDHYRVQTVELATGDQWDTGGRDKTFDREDMHGASVRGVLNADHTLLATLYRDPTNAEEPAFVHILDLQNAWAYCADLPTPFGTGPEDSDHIELTPADTVIVTTAASPRIAEIHIDEVHQPVSKPVTIDYRDASGPPVESASVSAPGFGHVIAALG